MGRKRNHKKRGKRNKLERGRKPFAGECCPICLEQTTRKNETNKELLWCHTCGQNAHKECFEKFRVVNPMHNNKCPICRSSWSRVWKLDGNEAFNPSEFKWGDRFVLLNTVIQPERFS